MDTENRRPSSRLTTVERNRLAKLRFWNGADTTTTKPPNPPHVPYIDLSVPGTTVCTKYLAAFREQNRRLEEEKVTTEEPQSPFATFLESMDKLKKGTLSHTDTDNVLSVLLKLEQQAEQNVRTTPEAVTSFGYGHVGTFNGGSNLRVHPSVRRSLSRRASIESLGYQSDVAA